MPGWLVSEVAAVDAELGGVGVAGVGGGALATATPPRATRMRSSFRSISISVSPVSFRRHHAVVDGFYFCFHGGCYRNRRRLARRSTIKHPPPGSAPRGTNPDAEV